VVDADEARTGVVIAGLSRQAVTATAKANAESTQVKIPLGEGVFIIDSSTFVGIPEMSSERGEASSASLGKLL
jgi:hypothetical protein